MKEAKTTEQIKKLIELNAKARKEGWKSLKEEEIVAVVDFLKEESYQAGYCIGWNSGKEHAADDW